MPINTTGNHQIDVAASEIATALRAGHPGKPDQYYYDWAERLRDEIIVGTLAMAGVLPPWVTGVNGNSKRAWFLHRAHGNEGNLVPLRQRYYCGKGGDLVRYASHETAQRAADKLNKGES